MDWARASLWGGKALGLALALLCLTRSIEPDGPAAWGIAAGGVLLILWGGGRGCCNCQPQIRKHFQQIKIAGKFIIHVTSPFLIKG